jgi:Ca2+-binding RTX toxin-like protein
MKSNLSAPALLFCVLIALWNPVLIRTAVAQTGTGPHVTLTLNETSQTAVVSWFGDQGVLYQLERSSDLTAWADASPVFTGSDNYIVVTLSIAGQRRLFVRFKDIPDVITAVFNPIAGVLTVTGGDRDSSIVISRNATGAILVNGGTVTITGGVPTVANTTLIQIFGRGGNDQLSLDEANGALPRAEMSGETGDDTLRGGSGADVLNGGPGNDTLLGMGGTDTLFGGDDIDTLTGGDADDQVHGEGGTDRMIWNPGDDTDLNEGGPGTDTVEVNGGGGDEQFTTTANGTRVRFDRLNPAPFSIDIGTCEQLVVNANGGADSFSATGNLAALIAITVDGGAGNDTLLGSNGIDLLIGGGDDDFIDGQQGNDVVFMGAGDDVFQWDPGDGSDTVEGQTGADSLLFNGSAGAEIFDASANGARVRFTRNIGTIIMDLDDLETINLNALGNTDTVNVNDLTGTDLARINVNLAGAIGGTIGDAQADSVLINGTGNDDIFTATLPDGDLLVTGLAATVLVEHFDTALDSVRLQGLGGDDIVDASAVGTGGVPLVLDGGSGHDILLGSAGADTLLGGDNDDVLLGNGGVDVMDGGLGDNTSIQDGGNVTSGIVSIFGDDQDNPLTISRDVSGALFSNGVPIPGATLANTFLLRIFGWGGNDTITLDQTNGMLPVAMIFGGAGLDTISGGAAGDFLFGGAGNDTLLGSGGTDLLFGGADNDSLTGGDADDQVFGEADADRMIWNPGDDTDLNEGGAGTDTVEVDGGGGDEQFTTTANGTRVRFDRLNPAPFSIDIGTCEQLAVNANGGNDSFSATGNLAALIQITVDGGSGNDTILGSNGIDLLIGGGDEDFLDGQQGNDVVFMGAGDDVFQWDPGDGSDTVEGQAGNDRLIFNGSGGAEIFDASANGGRVRFTRNLGNIVMDLDDIETLELNALGGIDNVIVNDLTGTDLTRINSNLAGTIGGTAGDAAADIVFINGTAGDDIVTATLPGGDLLVTGLAAVVSVDSFETMDSVRLQGLGGDDIVDAAAVGAGGPPLVVDGGAGDDILLGSAGADSMLGGDNDDVLLGNGGVDVMDGGLGDNISIQDGGNVTAGIISIFGDALDNTITISRDAAGALFSNGVVIPGATIANTALIRVFGQSGNDTITLNQSSGALPAAMIFGGAGLDTLTGGAAGDFLFGGGGNDTLLAQGGFDFLFGGAGNDSLTGGDADDQAFGQADTDRMIWNPGDDTDLNEGGTGSDTVEVNGGGGDEQFTTTANGTRVRFDRLNPAPFSIDIGTCEQLVLNANGGADSFSATGNLAALIQITVDGGAGNDTILGSNGIDLLIGGDNNDFIDGQQGNDVIFLGADDDTAQWDPGDGSDTIEGQAGNDRLLFNGSGGAEIFDASANGGRVRFTRNLGNIVMDLDDIETLDLNALGGIDNVVVNDLTGTDLTRLNVSLAGTIGGSTGDGAVDVITVNGTAQPDTISILSNAGGVEVSGLHALVRITHAEVANDDLVINGLGGADGFNLGPGVTTLIGVAVND